MRITKFGHCCLLIEQNGLRIMTDPGNYSNSQDDATDVDLILITHEHAEHLHIDSLKKVLTNNPGAEVVTNTAVAKLLDDAEITYTLMTEGQAQAWKDVSIEAFEAPHAELYPGIPRPLNTGFYIAEQLFYPGDAWIKPGKPVDILALPVAGPWMKTSEAVDYALAVAPRVAFPVHDAIMKNPDTVRKIPATILPQHGIEFVVIAEGETREL